MSIRDSGQDSARVFSIPPGAPFLPTLAKALKAGSLVPGFDLAADPLALSRATIYVPTRRAARALRAVLASQEGGRPAILPTIKALGEFDEGEAAFDAESAALFDLAPPIGDLDRLLLLAPVVQAWKRQLPAHVAKMFEEEVVVPVSTADSLWLARDLARLMDDVETEQSDWAKLASLVSEDYAGWWQVTLKFLEIVTDFWPQRLIERGQSNPAAHRNALIAFEAERLRRQASDGPVIAAGSTGSIPATAALLAVIARLPNGAVVLPGLGLRHGRGLVGRGGTRQARTAGRRPSAIRPRAVDEKTRRRPPRHCRTRQRQRCSVCPRAGWSATPCARRRRPTPGWKRAIDSTEPNVTAALSGVTLIEAANERDEALAIAIALRRAVIDPGRTAALVTGDRNLARRVSSELLALRHPG